MRILIDNAAFVLTQDRYRRILTHYSILLQGDTIEAIFPSEDRPPGGKPDVIVDASHHAVLPGMIDLHNHSVQTLFRGDFDGLSLMAWLRSTDRLYALLGSEDVYNAARLSFLEKISCGTTSVLDMERDASAVLHAARDIGIRLFFAYAMFDQAETGRSGLERINDVDSEVKTASSLKGVFDREQMASLLFGPVGFPSSSFELMERAAESARQLGLKIHSHLAETLVNDRLARNLGFRGEFGELEARGFFGGDVIVAHAVHVDSYVVDSMAKYGVSVAHCPSSNAKLGNGVAPVVEMLSKGVNVGLGTDGAASNDSESLLYEMKNAVLLQRGVAAGTVLSSQDVLDMATVNAASALGRDDLGSIEVGKRGDIVILDLDKPGLRPYSNVLDNVVYAADCRAVDTVIVGGRILVEGGRISLKKEAVEDVFRGFDRSRSRLEGAL